MIFDVVTCCFDLITPEAVSAVADMDGVPRDGLPISKGVIGVEVPAGSITLGAFFLSIESTRLVSFSTELDREET